MDSQKPYISGITHIISVNFFLFNDTQFQYTTLGFFAIISCFGFSIQLLVLVYASLNSQDIT